MTGPAEIAEDDVLPARPILILILLGVVAFCGFCLLAVYASELRGRTDGGAHALSSSAVGYRGAQIMLASEGIRVHIGRTAPDGRGLQSRGLVLTPGLQTSAAELGRASVGLRTLIVLPKWIAAPDPLHPGFVRKLGFLPANDWAGRLLARIEPKSRTAIQAGWRHPVLRGAGEPFADATVLPVGRLDGLQTLEGPGWRPVLVDEAGGVVLAASRSRPNVYVLADPDLLNNQGLSSLDTARAGMAILRTIAGGGGVVFDVTLAGLGKDRGLLRLMIEPPWLGASLCVFAAVLLAAWQACARFGAPEASARGVALGQASLVDNAATLVRAARREAMMAPAYADLTLRLVARAAGGQGSVGQGADWAARVAARRGLADPGALVEDARAVRTRAALMDTAGKLYRWRREMTRERD